MADETMELLTNLSFGNENKIIDHIDVTKVNDEVPCYEQGLLNEQYKNPFAVHYLLSWFNSCLIKDERGQISFGEIYESYLNQWACEKNSDAFLLPNGTSLFDFIFGEVPLGARAVAHRMGVQDVGDDLLIDITFFKHSLNQEMFPIATDLISRLFEDHPEFDNNSNKLCNYVYVIQKTALNSWDSEWGPPI